MSRVFIISPTDYDVTDALRYGKITVVFPSVRPSIWDHARFRDEFKKKIKALGFDNRKDYFLCIGTSVPMVLSTSFLCQDYGWVKVLFFHAAEQRYVMRIIGDEIAQQRVLRLRNEIVKRVDGTPQ
jgi:hypothetical protein